MPTARGDSVDDVVEAAASATRALETRLSSLAKRLDEIKGSLDAERAVAQRDREELDIEYSLEIGSQFIVEAPDAVELRAAERTLTEQAIRAAALQRQMADFGALIAASARQFAADGTLPGTDEATRVAIRSAAVQAQENERHRLAREVHDGPAQALANAIIGLEFVERAIRIGPDSSAGRALEEVERIKATLRDGLTEIRRFIFDLRPTMLQDRGLAATIEHYVSAYQSLYPMAIDFEPTPEIPPLTDDQELTAFRVIQESVQNARKHARATHAEITISRGPRDLIVTIADNGRGFSTERVTTHLMGGAGLRGMHERAALVGGTIDIQSGLGQGTIVRLTVPLAAPENTGESPGSTGVVDGLVSPARNSKNASTASRSRRTG